MYRNLAGSDYLVSVCKVTESEKNIRVNGFLPAHKVFYGVTRLQIAHRMLPIDEN